jgi:hypothetical protein
MTVIAAGSMLTEGSLPIETVVTLGIIDAAILRAWKPAVRLYRNQERQLELYNLSRQQ